ncbi:hypothetical protein [Methylobacterium brachythecii]|uniref:Uncharacterized protein n=1 Tax=Methylobacterium brachythecii TaxID=1176177 RepID=A0A7W6AJ51_9HYPH|nr:hypothetical protein [Methylobacterium brachythecii]MBB3900827.1 hypothetical protein [Methylobacterium brachythecii]GLS46049.1 hypothetical protein GCM10007884_40400 [Methylobacterium brachythecii]
MVMSLRAWISGLQNERAAVEAEARRLIARHGAKAPIVAKALAGAPGRRHTGFGAKVQKRVDRLAKAGRS